MQKELILDLIAHARNCADNAFCPYSGVPVGASLLTEENAFIAGCNIEPNDIGSGIGAVQSAFIKAITEGITKFAALCIWSERTPQYPTGAEQSLLAQFAPDIPVIIAYGDTYLYHSAHELIPQIRRLYNFED